MYEKIVVGARDTEHGREALALAGELASPERTEVIVARVVDLHGHDWDDERLQEVGANVQQELTAGLRGWSPEIRVKTRAIAAETPAGGLEKIAADESADLIVLGSTHRGPVGRVLVGTTAGQLLSGAPCAVAIAPRGYSGPMGGFSTIGAAFDGSPESHAALAFACEVARATGATVRAFEVIPEPQSMVEATVGWSTADEATLIEASRDAVRSDVDDALARYAAGIPADSAVRAGDPVHELRSAAKEGLDALVVGSRGHGPLRRVLTGSVSGALVRSCPVPVIVVPRPAMAEVQHRSDAKATPA